MTTFSKIRALAMTLASFAALTGVAVAQSMSGDTATSATEGSGWIGILIIWLIPAAGIGAAVVFTIVDKMMRASR